MQCKLHTEMFWLWGLHCIPPPLPPANGFIPASNHHHYASSPPSPDIDNRVEEIECHSHSRITPACDCVPSHMSQPADCGYSRDNDDRASSSSSTTTQVTSTTTKALEPERGTISPLPPLSMPCADKCPTTSHSEPHRPASFEAPLTAAPVVPSHLVVGLDIPVATIVTPVSLHSPRLNLN